MKKEKGLLPQFCGRNGIIEVSQTQDSVLLGYIKAPDRKLTERIRRYYEPQKAVEFRQIAKEEFDVLLERLYSGVGSYKEGKEESGQNGITEAAKAAPAENLLNSILLEAILKEASDIHMNITREGCRVCYRKDGKLMRMLESGKRDGECVIARIKLLSDLNILEHRKCQDGRFEYERNGFKYDIRVSILPGINGESVVMRLLGGNMKVPDLESLGFTQKQLLQIEEMLEMESGLFLVAGPTGSGKTTTLASIISRLNTDDVNIITVEDPVEYRIENILQINAGEEERGGFAEILKRVLRHDPDILMVGEIRDNVSAEIACRMALTGHRVFASIHTASCDETPLRLTDMAVPPYIVSAVLKGVISQRLIEKEGGGRKLKADISVYDSPLKVRKLCREGGVI